jgi:fibronectin-binding autotransporter adhesin
MITQHPANSIPAYCVALAFSLALVSPLSAVTYTFNSGQNWSVAENWEGGAVPEFNNEADLIFNSPIGVAAMRTDADRTVRSMTFGPDLPTNASTTITVTPRDNIGQIFKLSMEAAAGNASIIIENGFGARLLRYGTNSGATITMDLASDLDLRVNDPAATFGFNDAFSGTGAINKYGSGLATATRNNSSFSGGINIFQGTFATHANGASAGTGAINLGGSGSSDAATWSVGSTVSLANSVVVNAGAGARTISLYAAGAGNPTLSGGMLLQKDVIFDITQYTANTHDRITNSGGISGTGGIIKSGTGLLVLTAGNTYSGGTTISAGTLELGNGGSVTGNITNNSVLSINRTDDSALGNAVSGTGSLLMSGAGTVVLSASNSYSGGTTLNGGVLRLGNDSALAAGTLAVNANATLTSDGATARTIANAVTLGSGTANIALSSGDVTATGALTLSGPVTLGGTTGSRIFTVNTAPMTVSGLITSGSSTGAMVKNGTGTLVLANTANTLTNNFSIQGGTLQVSKLSDKGTVSSIGTMAGTSYLQIGQNTSSAILNYVGTGDTTDLQIAIGNADGSGGNATILNNGTGALVFDNPVFNVASTGSTARTRSLFLGGSNTNANAIQGVISDITALNKTTRVVKNDEGTWILSGANTYTGGTAVNAGTLQISATGSLLFVVGGSGTNSALAGTGNVSVDGRFVFNLAGASTNNGDSWTIVPPGLGITYGTNFIVSGFNGSGGLWTNTTNGVDYVFSQSTGNLTVGSAVPPTNNYASWVTFWATESGGTFTNTAGTADPDGDGFVNNLEFAFDGNPTVGTPALMTARSLGTNAVFNWIERKNPPGGVTYVVQRSSALTNGWTAATGLTISNSTNTNGILQPADYERREFVVPAAGKDFYRVQATVAE